MKVELLHLGEANKPSPISERLRLARLTRRDQAVRLLDMQRLKVIKDT
jgi:hypothetical protein